MGKYNLNAQTAFWQIRTDVLVFLKQDIENTVELPVDFRMELNAQNLFAVLHHVDGTILRPSGDGEPGRARRRNGVCGWHKAGKLCGTIYLPLAWKY